jgi:hypothetical protein
VNKRQEGGKSCAEKVEDLFSKVKEKRRHVAAVQTRCAMYQGIGIFEFEIKAVARYQSTGSMNA